MKYGFGNTIFYPDPRISPLNRREKGRKWTLFKPVKTCYSIKQYEKQEASL